MKGMLDFLEKAGLVKKDAPVEPAAPLSPSAGNTAAGADVSAPLMPVGTGEPLKMVEIYANAGIGASVYPAERLLRLVDGLSAMDANTRLMAIKAMDAADESWTINDPLADAAVKVKALAAHAETLQLNLQVLERETQARLDTVAARQAKVVGDIRKQISELEALVARELDRAAQEIAAQESHLKSAKEQTARELAEIAQFSQRLQSLSTQFGTPATTSQE